MQYNKQFTVTILYIYHTKQLVETLKNIITGGVVIHIVNVLQISKYKNKLHKVKLSISWLMYETYKTIAFTKM